MNHQRHAAPIGHNDSPLSRRTSLIGLGGVVLASAGRAAPARAGKAGKKTKKRCQRQVGACEAAVQAFCNGPTVEEDERAGCRTVFLPCCLSFTGCDAAAAYGCLIDGLRNPPQNR